MCVKCIVYTLYIKMVYKWHYEKHTNFEKLFSHFIFFYINSKKTD